MPGTANGAFRWFFFVTRGSPWEPFLTYPQMTYGSNFFRSVRTRYLVTFSRYLWEAEVFQANIGHVILHLPILANFLQNGFLSPIQVVNKSQNNKNRKTFDSAHAK